MSYEQRDEAILYSRSVINQVADTMRVDRVGYSRISLSNEEGGLAELGDPEADPLLQVNVTHTGLYWGLAGNPRNSNRKYEVHPEGKVRAAADLRREAIQVRRLVLGAYIGTAALERIPEERLRQTAQFAERVGGDAMGAWSATCAFFGAPLSMFQIGNVRRSQEVAQGSRVAYLLHPHLLAPTTALEGIHAVIRNLEARGR